VSPVRYEQELKSQMTTFFTVCRENPKSYIISMDSCTLNIFLARSRDGAWPEVGLPKSLSSSPDTVKNFPLAHGFKFSALANVDRAAIRVINPWPLVRERTIPTE
jgi:hypothetical protein